MVKQNWIRHPVIGVALFVLVSWGSVSLQENMFAESIQNSDQNNIASTTNPSSRESESHPPKDLSLPGRAEWRQEQDLIAQMSMAEWAKIMTIIAALGVVVTFVGVIFVALTLREAQHTTAAAIRAVLASEKSVEAAWETLTVTKDIGTKQVQPYLTFVEGRFYSIPHFTCFDVTIKNVGFSTAENIQTAAEAKKSLIISTGEEDDRVLKWSPELRKGPGSIPAQDKREFRLFFPGMKEEIRDWHKNELIEIEIQFMFTNVFGNEDSIQVIVIANHDHTLRAG